MIEYIETQTTDKTTIRIEVEPGSKTTAGFGRHAAATDGTADSSKDSYNQMLNTISTCASGVVDALQNLKTPPSAASIDFAIKIDAEAGAIIAKSPGEAQFKISLSWKQAEPSPDSE
jgi:hypothetical protein